MCCPPLPCWSKPSVNCRARHDPALRVTLVEANHIGYGASGRNGGFVMSLPPLMWLLGNLNDPDWLDEVRWTVALCTENNAQIAQMLDEEGIDAEWTPTIHQLLARNGVETATIRWLSGRFRNAGLHSDCVDDAQAQALIGYPVQALMTFPTILMHPFKLVRGLKQIVERRGVIVYENTPACRIETGSRGVTVVTDDGRIEAERVVLATNAYGKGLHNGLSLPSMSMYHTYLLATDV